MSKEAMKLALEALEGSTDKTLSIRAITALREALAKPDFWEGYVPEPDKRQQALDKKAENARALGLDYEPAQQQPVDFASLLREAEELVREKPTWKRFIEGTPLSNDIAVWMTVFAQDVARRTSPPAQRTWVGLTDEDIFSVLGKLQAMYNRPPTEDSRIVFARAIEAKLKEKNT